MKKLNNDLYNSLIDDLEYGLDQNLCNNLPTLHYKIWITLNLNLKNDLYYDLRDNLKNEKTQ